jgi:hypothetical protein
VEALEAERDRMAQQVEAAKADVWDKAYVAGSRYTRNSIYAGLAEEQGYSAIHTTAPINPYRAAQNVPSVVVFSDMATLEAALDAALREEPEQ